jgi:mannosyltransferase
LASVAVARRSRATLESLLATAWSTPVALLVLTAASLWLRTRVLNAGFWIDEGISVGVAHHHWTSIPAVLKQDGSPPAYYMLLGLWIRVFGDSERATHTLSLLLALGCIPLAYAAGRSVFDRKTGLVCAVVAAFDPFLTYYAQETRMYAFEAFLSLLAALAFVNGVLRGGRVWAAVLVPTLALMVYGHNWALFACVGIAAATVVVARDRLAPFLAIAIGVAVLYLPWVPTLLSQAKHTGAPWSSAPSLRDLLAAPGAVLGGDAPFCVLLLTATTVTWRRRGDRAAPALAVLVAVTVAAAWISSQVSPAWTTRYFAVILGPVLLLAGAAIVGARRLGIAALVILLFLWWGFETRDDKENARQIASALVPVLHPRELIVSTHPEQVPVLRYYLGGGLRWMTMMGPVTDPGVFDWRDAVARLQSRSTAEEVDSAVASVRPGSQFVVVSPVFRDYRAWKAKWTRLVWQTSTSFTTHLAADPRVRLVRHVQTNEIALHRNYFKPLQAFVYERLR